MGTAIRIDNVGMTVFMCRRGNSLPRSTTRKFKAGCGSVTEFTIDATGKIADIRNYREMCQRGCELCIKQTASARILIESGK